MERIRNTDHIRVVREERVAPPSGKFESSPIQKLDRALAAAASSFAEAREAFEILCSAIPDGAGDVVRGRPLLLTVPQVCYVLGYHKTKVYDLMKRGLLPFVVEAKTGHRRVEYQALQQLVKRLRGGRLERRAS